MRSMRRSGASGSGRVEELPSDNDDYETTEARRQNERAEDNYLNKLIILKEAFPAAVCCHYFEIGGCTHGRRCSCGGKRPPWPWIVRKPGVRLLCMLFEG